MSRIEDITEGSLITISLVDEDERFPIVLTRSSDHCYREIYIDSTVAVVMKKTRISWVIYSLECVISCPSISGIIEVRSSNNRVLDVNYVYVIEIVK